MKKRFWIGGLLAVIFAVLLAAGASAENTTIYVSSEGNALADGSSEETPTTLEHATELANEGDGPVQIIVLDTIVVDTWTSPEVETILVGQDDDATLKFAYCAASEGEYNIKLSSPLTIDNIQLDCDYSEYKFKTYYGTYTIVANGFPLVIDHGVDTVYHESRAPATDGSGSFYETSNCHIIGGGLNEYVEGGTHIEIYTSLPLTYVYGGGYNEDVEGNVYLKLDGSQADTFLRVHHVQGGGYVPYGSENAAQVKGNICLTLNNVSTNTATYGGGYNDNSTSANPVKASVTGNIDIFLSNSGQGFGFPVYGGGRYASVEGDISITAEYIGTNSASRAMIYGGGSNGDVIGDISITMRNCQLGSESLWGGGEDADITGNVTIEVYDSSTPGTENIHAGGEVSSSRSGGADVNGDVAIVITGGPEEACPDIFCSGKGYRRSSTEIKANIAGNVSVTLNGSRANVYTLGENGSISDGKSVTVTLNDDSDLTGAVRGKSERTQYLYNYEYNNESNTVSGTKVIVTGDYASTGIVGFSEIEIKNSGILREHLNDPFKKLFTNCQNLTIEDGGTLDILQDNEVVGTTDISGTLIMPQAAALTAVGQVTVSNGALFSPTDGYLKGDVFLRSRTAFTQGDQPDFSVTEVGSNAGYFTANREVSSDGILHEWYVDRRGYTLTYNANYGDNPITISDGVHEANFSVILRDGTTFTREGYKLVSWNENANGSGTSYGLGDTFSMPPEDITLYAQWEQQYTITYKYDTTAPTDAVLPPEGRYYSEEEVTPATPAAVAGYTFSGWRVELPSGLTLETDGTFTMPSADVVLVGSWIQNAPTTYTLTYNANYGDNPATTNVGAYEAGAIVTLGNLDTFIRNGYTLTGWNTAANGTGTSYNLGDTFAMPAEDVTLYAQWERQYVAIRPADVTIYMGGENGYEGAVSSNNEIVATDSLPVPGFVVTLPEDLVGVDVTDLILQYQEGDTLLQWEFVKYGGGDHNIYRIDPKEGTATRPVRMEFTNAAGETVTDDQFVIKDHLEQTLTMEVYGEGIQTGDVVVVYQGVSYSVTTGSEPAQLTVRGTTGGVKYGEIHTDVAQIPRGESGVVAAEGTVYTINNSPVQVNDPGGITLLFDNIIENNDISDISNTELLIQRADEVLAEMEDTGLSGRGDHRYEAKYLDLIDTNNGNAWVAADQEITVCWPLPEGTSRHTDFVLLHFEDLHRELGTSAIPDAIDHCAVTQVDIQVTEDHITFTVDSGGFSPFLLVWETKPDDKPDRPHRPDNNDDESSKPDETPELNIEDHYAYIVGYEDGTVRPEGYLTRAEVATIFFRLLTDTSREQFWTTQSDYSDVTQAVWYNNAIATMTNAGILKGYEDGTFRPDASITRAEFAAIAARFDSGAAETGSGFIDIAGHWAEAEICRAVSLGWIQGYEDGTFRPDQPITRAEVMTIVNRMLDRAPENEMDLLPDMNVWSDNRPGAWYYLAVQEATNSHTYIRKDGGYETWVAMLEDPDWTQYQ